MDVRLTAEQVALRESAARVVHQLGPRTVAQLADSERAAKLDAAVGNSGWRELRAATETGAAWASAVEAAIVAEELGRGLADAAFLGPTLAAELRRLARMAPSTSIETVVLTPSLNDLAAMGDDGAVAIDAAGSTSALLVVATSRGQHLAEVPVAGADAGVDLTRRAVVLDASPAVALPTSGHPSLSGDNVTRWTALGLSLACADLVGTMRGAIELACDYARSRRQYGAAIGSFQAVQHLLADAFVAMEGSRSVSLHAAWAVDALAPAEALRAAAVAKAYCGRAARTVCETAIQLHGGIGNTWDCLAHVYLRRALLSIDVLGGVGVSLARVLEYDGIGGRGGLL
ncbi:MAG TPA: acyl-CoA dehydrogenase family protein [Acidimicrobiales bacterium]|jgi:alkylation response protein AidB-like acyl-CoA dehydrogenase|nr:acyl-CoA dehydrogenase family protein [Acidimicrobiales bacterium]